MATNIIDPNDINASGSLVNLGLNASPDYSDMFIFAELTAERRGASILTSNGVGRTTLDSAEDAVKINLMGFDNESGQYTTKWTNTLDGTKATPFEGFGITNIHIKTNSSYMPIVDIEFVDIKGLSLITLGTKSPYSVIYSFPPPIFKLTVKGYYGKAIKYNLHLVKQNTRFDATSGNYFINANFVAQRYAPLTDILFKYVDIMPLMKEGVTPGGESNIGVDFNYAQKPKNTRELITRAKKLYDDIDQFKVDSAEASKLNEIKDGFTETQILINQIANFKTFVNTDLQTNFNMHIFNMAGTYSPEPGSDASTNDSQAIRKIDKLLTYDNAIKGFSPDEVNDVNFNQRLCLLYSYAEKPNKIDQSLSAAKMQQIKDVSKSLRNNLLREAQRVNSDIKDDSIKLLNENDLQPFKGQKFIGLDITKLYTQVRQDLVGKQQDYATKNKAFKDKINDIATRTLGFVPTIRNVFGIITNDVETVFGDLRGVCEAAETEHKNNFAQIVSNNNTKKDFISAFPLVLKTTSVNDSTSGGNTITRTERAYPGESGLGFEDVYFPEVEFVENFITTFLNIIKSEQIENLKESVDQDGNNKWLPVNPLDSVVNGRLNADSPYKNTYKVIGSPSEKSVVNELINRYYIASQYSYAYLYYKPDAAAVSQFFKFLGVDINTKNDDLVKYVAQAEATNLVNSMVDATLLSSLETQATEWGKNINGFYTALESSASHYANFDDQIDPVHGDAYLLINGQKITKNRANEDYHGFEMLFSQPVLRNKSNGGTSTESDGQVNVVEEFIDKVGDDGIINNLIFDSHGFSDFTKQNIAYIKDEATEDSAKYDSDFIENKKVLGITTGDNTLLDRFIIGLGYSDAKFKALLSDPLVTTDIKAFITLSSLCGSLTYYHSEVNKKFALPAVIEVPKFAHLNMGAYAYFYNTDFPTPPATDVSIDYTKEKYGIGLSADIYSTYINNIAKNDVDLLVSNFVDFISATNENGFNSLNAKILSLITEVQALNLTDVELKKKQYQRRLEPAGDLNSQTETDYSSILVKYIQKQYLLNYTEITFLPTNMTDGGLSTLPVNNFVPIKELNQISTYKNINDNYFGQFFKEVIKLCEEKKQNLNKIEANFQQSIQDNDIKTQTYYSFKAIADKWIVGLDSTFTYGAGGKHMIDLSDNADHSQDEFLFIDRFFNDIGDKVIIDFRPIVELSQDYDVSVFSVLARILALNGFEFFPIQNFLNFQQDEWQKSFKTYGSSRELILSQSPAFICMYIGGTSSQLDDALSGFEDDGFKDENALLRSPDYNVNNVKGFKVGFARQNQSMFTSIELNTNEHKETNESLAILSEIAQDQSASSPVPKGQNLFSTYEQRSYTCKVQGFGNMMIQPTQYFLLENVPMFNGAYLILDVEHDIIPNSMKTNFSGVRVRTNPNPLVTEFSTSAGVKSGDSDAITNGVVNQAGVTAGDGTNRNNPNSTGSAGFPNTSVFPTNPPITNDMTGRLISPQQ
jgi:hypothetical protein